jgi:oligosaccharide repeat unit polymerase
MILFLIVLIVLISVIAGKIILHKWINHLSVYSIIWGGLIFLYELKLLPYVDISPLAWFYIIIVFLCFFLGIVTVKSARGLFRSKEILTGNSDINLPILADGGRTLKYALIIFSSISMFAAIQNWVVLIDMFGSIPSVFLNANKIYIMNSKGGGVKGMVPFIPNFGFVAIFFAAIYTVYKGKFSFLTFYPLISVIIKEIGSVGRAAILLALMEFVFTFILFNHLLKDDIKKRFSFSRNNFIISFVILIILFIGSISLVRLVRDPTESFVGASKGLNKFKENLVLSPTLYLYLSSDVGVLSKYLDSDGERTKFGQNTFLTLYHILNKFDLVERDSDYQKGYYIPMWTNTATYIREIHADFGPAGTFIFPFILGIIITWLWFKFYEQKSMLVLTFLVYLYLIVGYSFLVIITRTSYWSISQFLILISIPIIERIAIAQQKYSMTLKS